MDARVLSFLLLAKKSTYAAHGAEASSSRPNSHDLTFAEGDLQYIDTYLGGTHFAGEEAVWQDGMPVWSMNYCGASLARASAAIFSKAPCCASRKMRRIAGRTYIAKAIWSTAVKRMATSTGFRGMRRSACMMCAYMSASITAA